MAFPKKDGIKCALVPQKARTRRHLRSISAHVLEGRYCTLLHECHFLQEPFSLSVFDENVWTLLPRPNRNHDEEESPDYLQVGKLELEAVYVQLKIMISLMLEGQFLKYLFGIFV